ncbi:endonuclease domain-containing protein [Corallincola spongiicola]|uniref:Endonuclease domain-containing protein n=1 Tax=Corallincola spongiicola TaxID=2520508 RepID=A0ABY1WKA8_9GAMM|nr:endonuclease domain-containing protein [Corallincola spongiicola]
MISSPLHVKARALRKARTDVEKQLWSKLRARQIQGCKFRRQVPLGSYIVDFVCLERHLIVELDGSQHISQANYDEVRTAYLQRLGFHVIRFWNNEVIENLQGVLEVINAQLDM